ncbi:uncharacterized protein Z518_04896 [Rhinocladiella mackenziei CBS 650.93]|uniref:Rhinocladiella mackenziei CBS 650.93 unplaced genomic scaffold supercont1.3, whole genome shotgun sequence n=1 Tax=Rhinocladiella mackenziei CBS 650.93 TaxID=1442369 RepID=A0A0D2JCS6_9EURO|nr:uncharacterized protein Z518_04896 [Rhinocladiella mackenziei CBS 650.93]KIX06920.1 hypothetical protein Z518_04896 [Rhinocladiella mackenziei CBS 650.93]
MANADLALLGTFQKHIEDMRNLSLCKICIKPFYEPFVLACGHTYCYSCLAGWFGGPQARKRKKNCPDCRVEVTVQPSPNYLLRDLVHMFISRAELLPEDETVQEHQQAKEDEASVLAADRAGGGLFKGAFKRLRPGYDHWNRGFYDPGDNILRCPDCHWELEDGECLHCGFRVYQHDEIGTDGDSGGESQSLRTLDSEFDDDEDENDGDFEAGMEPDHYHQWHTEDDASAAETTAADNDYYDEDDGMDGFIEPDEDDNEDEDASSISTTATINGARPVVNNRRHGFGTGARRERSSRFYGGEDDYDDEDHETDTHPTTDEGHSRTNMNYDEATEGSGQENHYPPIQRNRRSRIRIVISDDDDEEGLRNGEEDSQTEEITTEDSEDGDEEEESPENSEDGYGEEQYESEDSDVRPPQPSARRRQHLQSQRARRSNHSYQPHVRSHRGQQSHPPASDVRQHHHIRHRSNISQLSGLGRLGVYERRLPGIRNF